LQSRGRAEAVASFAVAACAIALASCGQKHDSNAAGPPVSTAAPPAAAPDIAADTAAAAQTPKDQPNFRVCMSSSLDSGASAPLLVPAGVIFESWGRKKGDERNPDLDSSMLSPGAVRYVVVLDRPVTLSTSTPCAETVAQALLSPIYEWNLPLARGSQELQFQVAGVENHMAFPLTDRLGDLVKKGLIFGYSTADIGNPRELKDDDQAR
jgi:hypothetical protein